MDDNRKKIIIKEIMFWKENRLLPEQYCNFLLALYTEGEEKSEPKSRTVQKKVHPLYWLSFLPLLLFGYVYYFTEFSINFQLVIFIFLFLMNGAIVFVASRKKLNFQIPLVCAAFLLLLITVNVIQPVSANNLPLFATVAVNCILWIIVGRKWKLFYFTISGILGLGVIILSFFI